MVDCGKIEGDFAQVSGDYLNATFAAEAMKVSCVVEVVGVGETTRSCSGFEFRSQSKRLSAVSSSSAAWRFVVASVFDRGS